MIAICKRQLEEIREKVVRELDKSLATIEKNVIEQLQ